MIEGHRIHEARINGRGTDPAGAFELERVDGPDGIEIIALKGELDLAATPVVRASVDGAAGARAVVIDIAGATFVDSSMLKELLRASSELARYDTRLVLAGTPPAVRRLLDLTRTAQLFALADDRAAALAQLGR
jgi:anti-sigma B factor antagonist